MDALRKVCTVRILSMACIVCVILVMGFVATDHANALTTAQRTKVEKVTMKEVRAHKSMITSGVAGLNSREKYDIVQTVLYNDPVLYSELQIGFYVSNGGYGKIERMYVRYAHSQKQLDAMEKVYKRYAKSCVAYAKKGHSRAAKVKRTHDYIAKHVTYKHKKASLSDALISGKACCTGYSNYFLYVMNELDIPCRTVVASDESHAWNQVKIGSKWYHVDVTWDDLGKKASRKYCLINDKKCVRWITASGPMLISAPENQDCNFEIPRNPYLNRFAKSIGKKKRSNSWKQSCSCFCIYGTRERAPEKGRTEKSPSALFRCLLIRCFVWGDYCSKKKKSFVILFAKRLFFA